MVAGLISLTISRGLWTDACHDRRGLLDEDAEACLTGAAALTEEEAVDELRRE